MRKNGVAVFCETENSGKIAKSTFELLGVARELADQKNIDVTAISFVSCKKEIEELGHAGADFVIYLDNRKKGIFNLESDTHAASKIISELNPEIVLFSATDYGRILAPKVAANIKCGITADCTDFRINELGKLVQIRPALGGNILAHIVSPSTIPQMATVRPGVFKVKIKSRKVAQYSEYRCEVPCFRQTVIEKERTFSSLADEQKIEQAKIIVAVGNGVRTREMLEKIKIFAETIGGVCGCSRKIVEAGLMSHSHQVGQSGKTVSPEIYIALGISGAVQHLAGMKTVSKIIAVNSDHSAPIFSFAHIGFVMDGEKWIDQATVFFKEMVKNG